MSVLLGPSSARADTVRVVYTRCIERPPLVDGAAVAAQARVELASTLTVMDPEDARPSDTELRLDVCGARAKLAHRSADGELDEREIDLQSIAADARVRVLALVLGELGRGRPLSVETVPVPPLRSAYAEALSAPGSARPDVSQENGTAREPRQYAQDLTFEVRGFTAPLSAAFGPRLSLAINRWQLGLQTASSSTTEGGVQLVTGLAAFTFGYVAYRSGARDSDTRFEIAPSFELGPTWVRAEASSESAPPSDGTTLTFPSRARVRPWVAGCVRAGMNVALIPPFHARFGILVGVARGLHGEVPGGAERTTSGAFFGLLLGIGWDR